MLAGVNIAMATEGGITMKQEADLWQLTTRSEAVYLDAVADDASSGFIGRLCRFPEKEMAWAWLHIFHHDHIHSYTDHTLQCTADTVDEAAHQVEYLAREFHFSRTGDRMHPEAAMFSASALMHAGPTNPHGEGVLPCEIQAVFSADLEGVQSLAGRSEVLGTTRAAIALGDANIELFARGQFHEQIQQAPRFDKPFSYASLRGDGAGCIFIRGLRGATGTVTLDHTPYAITAVRLSEPATVRKLEIDLENGRTIRGETTATYQYEIPIFHMTRPGSLVYAELDGVSLSGCINDLVFGEYGFENP